MKQQPDIQASYPGGMGPGEAIGSRQLRQSDPRQISMQPIQVDPQVAATFSERGREQNQGPYYQLQSNQTDTMTRVAGSMQGNHAGGQRQSSNGDTVIKQGRGDMSQSGSVLEIPYMYGKVPGAAFSDHSLGHGVQVGPNDHYGYDEIYGSMFPDRRDARKSKNRSSAKVATSQSESILKGRVSQTHGNSIQVRNVQFDLDSKEAQQLAKLKSTKMPRPRKNAPGSRKTSAQPQQVQNAGAAVNMIRTSKEFCMGNEFRKLIGASTPLADSNMRYQLLKTYNPTKSAQAKKNSASEAFGQPQPRVGTAASQEWGMGPEGVTGKTIQSQHLSSNKSFSNKIINEMTQLSSKNNTSALQANRTQYNTSNSLAASMAYLDFQQPYGSTQSFTDPTFQRGFRTATAAQHDSAFFQRRTQSVGQGSQSQDRYAVKNLNILQNKHRKDLYIHRKKNKSKIAFSMKQGDAIIIKDIPKKQLIQEIERQQQNQRLHDEMAAGKPMVRSPSAQPYLRSVWAKRYPQTRVMADARRGMLNISSAGSTQNQLEGARSGNLTAYGGGSGSPQVPVRYADSCLFYNPQQSYTAFSQPQKFQSISSSHGGQGNPAEQAGVGRNQPLNVVVDMHGGGSNHHSKSLLEHTTTINQQSHQKIDSKKELDDNRGDAPQQLYGSGPATGKHASSQDIEGKGLGRNYSQFPDTDADHKFGSIITPTSLHQDIINQFQRFENPKSKAPQANGATRKGKRKSQNTNSNPQASKTFNPQEQDKLSSRNLDYDIAQNAQFTNESLNIGQLKRLDLQKMSRQPLDDSAKEMNKEQARQHSRDSSSALYATQDQVYFAKRLASKEQSEIASGVTHDSAVGKAAQKSEAKKYSDQGIKLSDGSQKNLNIAVAQKELPVKDQELKQGSTAKFMEREKSNSVTVNGKSSQPEPKKDQNQGRIEGNNEIKSRIVSYEEDIHDNGKDKKSLVDEEVDRWKLHTQMTPPYESGYGSRRDENHTYDLLAADLFQAADEMKDGPKAISDGDQAITTKELVKLKRRFPLGDLLQCKKDPNHGPARPATAASRAKPPQFNNQKEAWQAAYSREYKQERRPNYDDNYRDAWEGIDIRRAYHMDVIQNQLYKNRFPRARSRPRSSSDSKAHRDSQPTIRQINALKERIVERDGGEYNESALSHIISIRPGPEDCPEDAEDEERKKTMLAEANWLKQIRKQRYLEGQLQTRPVQLTDKNRYKIADLINDPPLRQHKQNGPQANSEASKIESGTGYADSRPSPRSRSPQREVRGPSSSQELKPKDLHVQKQKSSASRKHSTPSRTKRNKSQRQLDSKNSPLKTVESRSQLSQSPSRNRESKMMSYQERYGSKARHQDSQNLAEYVPNIPITENQKVKIARHLIAIMTDIEASRRLDYAERHALSVQLSRYLQKLTQATDNCFAHRQKVMLRGKDRRAEVIEKCAQTIIHYISHPDVIDMDSLGTGRLSLLQYVDAQAQEAIHVGIKQHQDDEKNKADFVMLQKQREIKLKKLKKKRGSDFDGEMDLCGLSSLDSDGESEGEEANEADHSDVEIPSSRAGSNLKSSKKQAKKRKTVKKQKLRRVKSKPKFILKDISHIQLDELSDSDEQIIEKTQSLATQRNMCRGKHTLDKYYPASVANQPKYFTFDEHIYDVEVLFSRKSNMEKSKSTDDQNGFFSPNLQRRSSLLEDIDGTWLSTILGKVMSENPDNVVRHDRIRNHMALNKSGIRDVFMTSQHPRMTLEQQEYLIIEEIRENCLRAHQDQDDGRSIEEVYQERYQKEIQRRARSFCERRKVTTKRRVDFGVITNEDKDESERNQASKDGEDERNAREHQQGTLEEANELKPPPQSILKKKGYDSGLTESNATSLATTPRSKGNKDKGGHNSGSRPSGEDGLEVRRQSRRMIVGIERVLGHRVSEMQKPFVMDDDTRSFFDSVLSNDWQNVLRLCRKVQNIVNKTNEKEQKPLQLAFKYQSYEAAAVLMRFGAGHPSCPENIEKCKSFIEALVKENLYEADYDLDPSKPSCDANQVAEGRKTIRLNQIEAILETLDPIFDRLVYDQISKLQKLDDTTTMSRRKKGELPLSGKSKQMLAKMRELDVDSYNSQMQYLRDLIIEGKLEDYEKIVKEYMQLFDGPKEKKAFNPADFS